MHTLEERLVACVFCFLMGGCFCLLGIHQLIYRKRFLRYKVTLGKIISRKVDGDGTIGFFSVIRYSYHVKGKEYQGSRMYASGDYLHAPYLSMLRSELPLQDQKINVYYDPDQPQRSCMRRDGWMKAVVWIGVGSLFIWGSVLFGMDIMREML